jgi:hypothetical protein
VQASDGGKLSLVLDDTKGHLLELPFEVDGEAVKYGTPEVMQVAASGSIGPRTLASWASTPAARPSTQEAVMDVDQTILRKRLGLADDADEAAITAALNADPEPAKPAPTSTVPEGAVLIDKDKLAELEAGSKKGVEVAASLALQERDGVIAKAAKEGRFAVGRRAHYETMWDKDPEGTKHLLTAKVEDGGLAPGSVPVGETMGASGDGEENANEDAVMASFEAQFFPELATTKSGGAS